MTNIQFLLSKHTTICLPFRPGSEGGSLLFQEEPSRVAVQMQTLQVLRAAGSSGNNSYQVFGDLGIGEPVKLLRRPSRKQGLTSAQAGQRACGLGTAPSHGGPPVLWPCGRPPAGQASRPHLSHWGACPREGVAGPTPGPVM